MSPNLESQIPELPEIEPNLDQINLTLTPLSDLSASTSLSDGIQSSESESHEEVLVDELADLVVSSVFVNLVSLEHNIRELLVRASSTEHLETVTQINLRVIAREVALQQLGFHLPALRELTLDGSIISSFRDLGDGLKNVKILRVNRCQLTCIDGVFGFENLEELYAADNAIKDVSPCAFLTNLRVIDLRRNCIKSLRSVNFLNLCPELLHLLLEGNEIMEQLAHSRRVIGHILPDLKMLDDAHLERDSVDALVNSQGSALLEVVEESSDESLGVDALEQIIFPTNRTFPSIRTTSRSAENANEFVVRFPPRIIGNSSNHQNTN